MQFCKTQMNKFIKYSVLVLALLLCVSINISYEELVTVCKTFNPDVESLPECEGETVTVVKSNGQQEPPDECKKKQIEEIIDKVVQELTKDFTTRLDLLNEKIQEAANMFPTTSVETSTAELTKDFTTRLDLLTEKIQEAANRIPTTSVETSTADKPMTSTPLYVSDRDKVTQCSVGMKDGRVLDPQITASSVYSNKYRAADGRLDNTPFNGAGGVWAPHKSRRTAGEWIQVDLLQPVRVTGVVTQGRSDLDEWITSYKIQYGNSTLRTIKDKHGNDKVFEGNTDRNTYALRVFPQPLVARYFRLVVQTYQAIVSIRMDYVTC